MLLSFAIQLTQPVNLALYRLCPEYSESGDNPIILHYNDDPDSPEEFLYGERIGYLAGAQILDGDIPFNIEPDPDRGERYYKYKEIDENDFCRRINDCISNNAPITVMKGVTAYGFDGEPLIIEHIPEGIAGDTSELTTGSALSLETTSSALSVKGELPPTEGKIQNYLVWNGMLAEKTEEDFTYTDGKYVIVLEPTTEETRVYNSFIAFEVSTSKREDQLLAEEYPGLYFEYPADPVNLLTGSFNWEYTDISLYGKYDSPFTRYYGSSDAGRNHGMGYGWSSNYSIELAIDTLYAKVTLPKGRDIYFDLYYDGTYRSKSGSAFTIKKAADGYLLINKDGTVYTFGLDKKILSVSTIDGNEIIYTYNGEKLDSVSNNTGTLYFTYNSDGNISTVSDSIGRSINLTYNGGFLSSVENADSDSPAYAYDASGYLTTVKNFNGDIYLNNTYNDAGCVISQYVHIIHTTAMATAPLSRIRKEIPRATPMTDKAV